MELLLIVLILILFVIIAIIWVLAKSQKGDPGTNDRLTDDIEQFARSLDSKSLEGAFKSLNEMVNNGSSLNNKTVEVKNSPFAWVSVDEKIEVRKDSEPLVKEKIIKNENENKSEFLISILLVDDSPTVLKFTGTMLNKNGYEVITKNDGKEAFDYLTEQTNLLPDVIISDIEMPNKNGVELIKELREINKFKNIPIIIISASAEKHLELMSTGLIQGFLHKPFEENDLLSQLRYVLLSE